MPFSKKKMRDYMRGKRTGITDTIGITGITKEGTMKEWQHLKEFIERTAPEGTMSYLERHQRIAGSLGKLADQVEWGGLSVQEIKEVIGELPPLYPKD